MNELVSDNAETARARSRNYALLAAIYRAEPKQPLLDELRRPATQALLADLNISFGPDFQRRAAEDVEEDLAIEYTQLFIGPGPHLSPHESIHVEAGGTRDGELYGAQTVKVKAFIEATGLRYADDFGGLPDHIAAELEFMARLCAHEAEHWAAGERGNALACLRIERRFFNEHLGQWVPRFCGKIIDRSESSFYGAAAALTRELLQFDGETLHASLPADAAATKTAQHAAAGLGRRRAAAPATPA